MAYEKMAYIGKIVETGSIAGADRIQSAVAVCGTGGKWCGVVPKEINIGELVEVYLPDSIVPPVDRFKFMEQRKYRVKMMRFKGVPSECLIMPLSIAGELGQDITESVGVTKYSKPVDGSIAGDTLGDFPAFIRKTDEMNFQSVPHLVAALAGQPYYVTEKADGTSCTVYKYQGHFGVCSRNRELKELDKNGNMTAIAWVLARKYKLEDKLDEGTAIQFEAVGGKIQGNPMGLTGYEARVFDIFKIGGGEYAGKAEIIDTCEKWQIPTVKLLESGSNWETQTDDELRESARGTYANGKAREGIVIRPATPQRINGDRLSFKVINLDYKG